jgi:signal transduction histidine kinase
MSYDIKHLIEDLLFSLRVQPRFKNIHFTIEMGRDIPNVEMDVGQIQQVLMNLLNNAADAIEEKVTRESEPDGVFKREIALSASYDKESEAAVVEITDNGVGIPEEILPKVFNVHFSTKKGGHGLGLSNCRKIVEQHHGELTVNSAPGEGTTFRMVLPTTQPKEKSAAT